MKINKITNSTMNIRIKKKKKEEEKKREKKRTMQAWFNS